MRIVRFRTGSVIIQLFVLIFLLTPHSAFCAELALKSESAVLLDAASGRVLYEKDPHKILYPASMTKLMTLIVAVDAIREGKASYTDIVTASPNAASYKGSRIFLTAGEKLTMKEMLLGIALASGNDACVAVAEHLTGSHEAFVELMNEKAAVLGLKNTHFVNSNGLHDPEHYTTAYDFAQIGLHALAYPEIMEMSKMKHYLIREDTRPFQYNNSNKLLWFYQGVDGFKTGWTSDAKYCFTGTVERNGFRLVSAVMGATEKGAHFEDTKALYNWAFSQYTFRQFYQQDEVIGRIPVGKGVSADVIVVPARKVGVTLPKGQDKNVEAKVEITGAVDAPVRKGQVIGRVLVMQNGTELDRVDLWAGEDVAKGSWWEEFRKVMKSTIIGTGTAISE